MPAQTLPGIIIVECVEDRPQYSSYLTAWVTDDLKYILYYITLFSNKTGHSVFEQYFENLSRYNSYRELLPPELNNDYRQEMQYESLLDTYINYKSSPRS